MKKQKLKEERRIELEKSESGNVESESGSVEKWDQVRNDGVQFVNEEILRTVLVIQENEALRDKLVQEFERCSLAVECGVSTIAISWCLGEVQPVMDGDWIGLVRVGEDNAQYLCCLETKGERSGMNFVASPVSPGLYCFKFFPAGTYSEIATSDTIYIGPEIELEISFEEVFWIGSWKLIKGEVSNSDWFGLYRVGASNKNYIVYFRLDQKKQFMVIDVPLSQGEYELRYFPYACGYTPVKYSNTILVDGDDSMHLEFEIDEQERIEKITVFPNINSIGTQKSDWIGLYNTKYESYQKYRYVNGETSVLFPCPKEVGSYQFRYHSSLRSRNEEIIRSEIFEVKNTDILTLEASEQYLQIKWNIHSQPKSSYDWIGLYHITEPSHKQYLQYSYIPPNQQTTLYPLPTTPGIYEIRFFSSSLGKYTPLLTSNQITIQ